MTHYVVVRSDLPLGFLAAQVVHGAGESSPGNLDSGTNAVVLAVPDEAALLALERKLQLAGVAHVAIREPDSPWLGALTCIGLVPVVDRGPLRHLLCGLPLLGKRPSCKECSASPRGLCYEHNGGRPSSEEAAG